MADGNPLPAQATSTAPASAPLPAALPPERLLAPCDPALFDFDDTSTLPEPDAPFGQARALQALQLALAIPARGYNLFVLGPAGSGRHATVRRLVEAHAATRPAPPDWCYIDNFAAPDQPRTLCLPAGEGQRLKRAMSGFTTELGQAIGAALESDEYRARLEAIQKEAKDHEESLLHERPRLRRQMQMRVREVTRDTIALAAGHLIDELKQQFTRLPQVLDFLDEVRHDVVHSGSELRESPHEGQHEGSHDGIREADNEEEVGALSGSVTLRRYEVNLLVPHDAAGHAPVVFCDHPTYPNLVGRVDHLAHLGTLLTNFTLVRPGDLHRANGGFLLLDAAKVVAQPYAWEALKRTLRNGSITIESLPQLLGWINTVPLQPQSIPIDLKVVLFGEREDYYLLHELDPEFDGLFEIAADFDDDVPREPASCRELARVLGAIARAQSLRPLDRGAVARIVEHASRLAEDAGRLTTRMRWLAELLHESHGLAQRAGRTGRDGAPVITREDVSEAIAARQQRADRVRDHVREAMLRDTLLIATDGAQAAQVNALAVAELGGFRFGHPVRVTATVRLGDGHVVDIERESALGGPIHTKGVMILAAFLGARHAQGLPLSLSATLVFEQSYDILEGDSASLAELCALLSALGEVPIRQTLAVTGSVNQHGRVQAVGAVNEKIEGFFDLCNARGLTGSQGVLVPRANVQHLMLREDVVAAARAGRFHVFAVDDVDEAMALLTGEIAGRADARGHLPVGSINQRVAARLAHLSELRRTFEAGLERPLPHAARRRKRPHPAETARRIRPWGR